MSNGTNWRTLILPYIEQGAVHSQLSFTYGASFTGGWWPYSGGNEVLSGLIVDTYQCPSSVIKPFESILGLNSCRSIGPPVS